MIHSKTLFKVKKSYLIALLAIFCLNGVFASSKTEGANDQAKEKEFKSNTDRDDESIKKYFDLNFLFGRFC